MAKIYLKLQSAVLGLLLIFSSLTGWAQNLTITTSGETGPSSGTNWSIVGNELLVGSSGSATIHPSVITDHLTNTGDLVVHLPWQSGTERTIFISSSIQYTGSTARTLQFQSGNNIIFNSSTQLTSSNAALNVVLHARMGATASPTHGQVSLANASVINTNGGHLWAGGGTTASTTWNGLSVGDGSAITTASGVQGIPIIGSTITTNGGNLYMSGLAFPTASGGLSYGVYMDNSSISTGSGSVTLDGTIRGAFTFGAGVSLLGSTGAVNLTTTSGSITITGNGFDDGINRDWRVGAILHGQNHAATISSQSGDITMVGNAQFTSTLNNKEGLVINSPASNRSRIISRSGNITLTGTNTREQDGRYSNSIRFTVNNAVNAIRIGFDGTNAYSGNIIIEGNSIFQQELNPLAGTIAIQSTGTLTIQPTGSAFTYNRAAGGTLANTYNAEWNFGTTLSGFTYGKTTNTLDLYFNNPLSVAGPVTMYGGDITINENVNTSAGGANGDVLVKSTANIVFEGSKSITTSGGDVILWANSDGATTNGGVFFKASSSITTGGGHIWIAGGSGSTTWNGLTVGDGFAVSGRDPSDLAYIGGISDWTAGVALIQTTLSSAGGNIYIAGQRNSSSITLGGGFINNSGTGTLIDAGAGTVTIKGSNTALGNGAFGIMTGLHPNGYTGRFVVKSSNSTAANAIVIEGTTSGINGDGILVENYARFLSTATTNGGGISITGTGVSPRNALSVGIGTNFGTLDVLSASGAINLNVGIYPLLVASQGNLKLGSISGDADVASSTANVVITSNNVSWTGSVPIRTSGTLIVTPTSGGTFASTMNSTALNYSGITGLVLGNATNTANVTIGAATSIAGPITLYGGTLTFSQNLSSSNGGAISLYGNALSFATNVTVSSTGGSLLVAPNAVSTTIGLAGASGTLQITATHLSTNFANGFSNITIGSDNQTGAIATNAFTLQDPVTFKTSGSLTLGGILTLGVNDITLGSSMSVLGMPTNFFRTNSTGVVRRSIGHAGSGLFPVGNSRYNPVTIANNTGAADDFSARVADAVLDGGSSGTAITDKVVNRTWHIGKTNPNGGSGVDMTFQWNTDAPSDEGTNLTDFILSHFGDYWGPAAGTSGAITVNGTTKSMTHTGYTGSFSPFGIGSTGGALPVSWVDFTATRAGQTIELNWRTGSEQNTKDFVVQHSTGSGTWRNIGHVAAAGFSSSVRSYSFTHTQPVDGRNQYRLLQRDLDGKESLSKVVSVVMPSAISVQVYPVPSTNGSVFVKLPADQVLKVFNSTGILMLEQQGKAGVQSLDLQTLPKGLYYLQAGKETVRVMLQ